MEHGERRVMERGETLEEAGEPAQWVAFVERGCFKYMVHNDEEGKDYCTGFARGRVPGRLPLLPRRRCVGGEYRGRHAVRGVRHQRTGVAGTVRQRPEDGEDGREDTQEPVHDGLWTRPRPLPLHRP